MLRIPSRTWKLIGTIVTLFSVVALLLAACGAPTAPRAGSAVLDDWVMEGYNPARTRARSSALAMPISLQRELRIPEDRGVGSPLVITKNTMLVEAEYHLRAIDLTTGNERWSFPEAGRYISPAIAGEMVYIRVELDNQGKVFGIDLDTGEQRWEFKPRRISGADTSYWGGHLTSPVVSDNTVYIGAGKELYALNSATGELRWEYGAGDYVFSSASVDDGRVFISDAGHLYALDQQSGTPLWKVPHDLSVYFSPIVAGGSVIITNGAKLLALDAKTGGKRWETGFEGERLLPGAVQGDLLIAKSTAALFGLDLASGKELWRSDFSNYVSFPVVAGEHLFLVTGATGVTAVSALEIATGKQIWTQSVPALSNASPVIAGQTVYLRTTDGRVLGMHN